MTWKKLNMLCISFIMMIMSAQNLFLVFQAQIDGYGAKVVKNNLYFVLCSLYTTSTNVNRSVGFISSNYLQDTWVPTTNESPTYRTFKIFVIRFPVLLRLVLHFTYTSLRIPIWNISPTEQHFMILYFILTIIWRRRKLSCWCKQATLANRTTK